MMQMVYIVRQYTFPCWMEEVTIRGAFLSLEDALNYIWSIPGIEATEDPMEFKVKEEWFTGETIDILSIRVDDPM